MSDVSNEEHVDVASGNFILPDIMIKKEGARSAEDVETLAVPVEGSVDVKEEKPRSRILKKIKINNKPSSEPLIPASEIKAEQEEERKPVSLDIEVKDEPLCEEQSDESEVTSGTAHGDSKKTTSTKRESLEGVISKFNDQVDSMEILIVPSCQQSIFEQDIDIEDMDTLGDLNTYSVISSQLVEDKQSAHLTIVVSAGDHNAPCTHEERDKDTGTTRNWENVNLSAMNGDVNYTSTFTPMPSLSAKSPAQLFKEIWDITLMQKICQHTNAFASEQGVILNLTVEELYKYFGVLLSSGFMCPETWETYWHPLMGNPLISSTMEKERFEMIHKNIQFNDLCNVNNSDQLFSMRPVLDQLNTKFPELLQDKGGLFSLEKCDEPYYMQKPVSLRILSDRKMTDVGYKAWCLNTPQGYLLKFSVCCSMEETPPPEMYSNLPADCTLHLGHNTTSLELLETMSGLNIKCIGEIAEDKLASVKLNSKLSLLRDKNITLLHVNKGHDLQTLVTNIVKPEVSGYTMVTKNTRKGKEVEMYPVLLKYFNEGFGGTKIFETERSQFRCGLRMYPLLKFCLNASMVNAWLLHKALYPRVSHMEFLQQALVELCGAEFDDSEEDESECESECGSEDGSEDSESDGSGSSSE